MHPFPRWLGPLTPRFFNVLAEVNALGRKPGKWPQPAPRWRAGRGIWSRRVLRAGSYLLLARLASSRSEEVFGDMDTTM